MGAAKRIVGLVGLLIVAPIWYYLIYKILHAIQATELMWFLFWIYVPAALLVQIVAKIAESSE